MIITVIELVCMIITMLFIGWIGWMCNGLASNTDEINNILYNCSTMG